MNTLEIKKSTLQTLLRLQERARNAANTEELSFIITNETKNLIEFRQAVLWTSRKGIRALSGVSIVRKDAPFVQWVNQLSHKVARKIEAPLLITANSLSKNDSADWNEWLPPNGIALPFLFQKGRYNGLLLLTRESPWNDHDIKILSHAVDAYSHAWALAEHPRSGIDVMGSKRILLWPAVLTIIFLVFSVPVPLTVLAPAEIVPIKPLVVRAPLSGVVEKVFVQPNQFVKPGDVIFSLDKSELHYRLQVAKKTLETSKTRHIQASQQALYDQKKREQLPILLGRVKENEAEVLFLEERLSRIIVTAKQSGVAIINNPNEWTGRPVALGERVVLIADPDKIEVEAWISISDVIQFPNNSKVRVFLNSNPLKPLNAKLRELAFEAIQQPDGTLAHRARAVLDSNNYAPRIGQRGTARIHGERVPLFFWVFRRPLASIRAKFGL